MNAVEFSISIGWPPIILLVEFGHVMLLELYYWLSVVSCLHVIRIQPHSGILFLIIIDIYTTKQRHIFVQANG